MTALQVLLGIVGYLVLGLMIYLLVRSPRNVPLRAVTVAIACFGLAYLFGLFASTGHAMLGLEPITSRLIQHLTQLVMAYSLILFFLFSALDVRAARRRALWHAGPLIIAAVIMTVATVAMPDAIRDAAAALPSGRPGGPVAVPSVALLYLTVNVYRAYAFCAVLLWIWRYARRAEPRVRRGMALASVGLAVIVLSLLIFASANVVRWSGGVMPRDLLMTGIMVIFPGWVIFLIGFAYPAARMRLAALRVWWQHRRTYRRLGPLWTVLHQEFPEDALSRVPGGRFRDSLRLRGVHRRYYRRVIECRDGLVRVSPYLGPDGSLADRLRDGLRAHASGTQVSPRATPVAIPAADGLDADVRELVALSDALVRA